MIRYECEHCGGLSCETSVCPECGQRTELVETSVLWCDHCGAPTLFDTCPVCGEKGRRIGSDIRPVFPEERLLLEVLLGEPMKYAGCSVWSTMSNIYIIDGKVKKVTLGELAKANPEKVRSELEKYREANQPYVDGYLESDPVKTFIRINNARLTSISDEAKAYIRARTEKYNFASMFVSFSGGKDSTVVSDLVMKALGTESIVHLYGDTTLEYPSSHVYVDRFRKAHRATPIFTAKNSDQDFNDLCKKVGPPSRVMRWCCTVFKTGAITKTIEKSFPNSPSILTFFGLRRNESNSRSKYDRDTDESKIKRQVVASPIIDWTSFDDWLYILGNHVDFNDAYRLGFSRVGCWCCPNNSMWSGFLSSIYMPEEYGKFQNVLYDFAKSVGKPDWKQYVDEGSWKARQGGNGLEMSKNAVVAFKPCAFDENAINFDLNRPIDDFLYTLFIPFGIIDKDMGDKLLGEVYVLDKFSRQPLLILRGRPGSKQLRVAVVGKNAKLKNFKVASLLVTDQITKFQTCIACGACSSVCPFGAITVKNRQMGDVSTSSVDYRINPEVCRHCHECIAHFDNGCYMKKVLRIRKDGKVVIQA